MLHTDDYLSESPEWLDARRIDTIAATGHFRRFWKRCRGGMSRPGRSLTDAECVAFCRGEQNVLVGKALPHMAVSMVRCFGFGDRKSRRCVGRFTDARAGEAEPSHDRAVDLAPLRSKQKSPRPARFAAEACAPHTPKDETARTHILAPPVSDEPRGRRNRRRFRGIAMSLPVAPAANSSNVRWQDASERRTRRQGQMFGNGAQRQHRKEDQSADN
jgi:hypothetical protein